MTIQTELSAAALSAAYIGDKLEKNYKGAKAVPVRWRGVFWVVQGSRHGGGEPSLYELSRVVAPDEWEGPGPIFPDKDAKAACVETRDRVLADPYPYADDDDLRVLRGELDPSDSYDAWLLTGAAARCDPMGGYHGEAIETSLGSMVIQGPEIKVQAAAPEIQKCLF